MVEKERLVLAQDEKSDQTFRAIAMLNRLSVAEIKSKRANRLSDTLAAEVKEIRYSISSLSDSLILGEDVQSDLVNIDMLITELEQKAEL